MPSLPRLIMEHASESPEGSLLCPNVLLHLGNRDAVDQALSRLARSGRLSRVVRVSTCVRWKPVFGPRPPSVDKVIESLAALWGETIVPCGGAAANALGLTTQVPVRSVYLTSGPNRRLNLGEVTVDLRHAPRWQLVAPHRSAGDAVRALAWLGPQEVEENLGVICRKLSAEDLDELAASRALMPAWIAEPVSAMVGQWLIFRFNRSPRMTGGTLWKLPPV